MDAIWIPQLLQVPDRTKVIPIDGFLPNFDTLTSVRGDLRLKHGGNFLEVWTHASTIVTLSCDRCLQQYNYRLRIDTSEIIWLTRTVVEENVEVALRARGVGDDLSESLPRQGNFEPQAWLYEQCCLAMPLRQLCQQDCQPVTTPVSSDQTAIDNRWASLADLKKRLASP